MAVTPLNQCLETRQVVPVPHERERERGGGAGHVWSGSSSAVCLIFCRNCGFEIDHKSLKLIKDMETITAVASCLAALGHLHVETGVTSTVDSADDLQGARHAVCTVRTRPTHSTSIF